MMSVNATGTTPERAAEGELDQRGPHLTAIIPQRRWQSSMMAGSTNAPCKSRIQMRKTNPPHLLTFGLQRTAGPYRWVIRVVLTWL